MELWDIYDVHRMPKGTVAVRGEGLKEGDYHMVVHICIFNSKGEMLIQQRQSWKTWPEHWDVTVGGSAVKGETSQEAMHRELLEEIGIDHDFSGLRPAMTLNFDRGFDDFYLITRDIDLSELRLQPEEVKDARWASMEEIFEMIDGGTFIPFFKSFVQLLFEIRNKPDCLNV